MVDAKNKGTLSPPGRYCGRLEWRSWKQRLPIWSVSLILKSTIDRTRLAPFIKPPQYQGRLLLITLLNNYITFRNFSQHQIQIDMYK